MANNKEVTRDEVVALRASVQVLLEQTEKMLAKMDDQLKQQAVSNVGPVDIARIRARRMKKFFPAPVTKKAGL